ncbi:membrane protein [Paenibacillus swuensis]|uniref:Membrane protein n=1 Tax=Paenibacillus swuensis TaxID=1178515 RepID=A0A172TE40_9BACL|nr:DMT family transporter [Paenibacillus swuensis]ANE45325.1 membrane protein [Paenibacillus swuensis]
MILGLLLAILAGTLVSLQNIFNSKVNEHAASSTTTTLVLGMGFAASMTLGLFFEGGQLFHFHNMQTWYWFSGIIGVGIVTCIVRGIRLLGPTYAISIILMSQLGFALLWDSQGWLGVEQVPFTSRQLIGVLVIVGGILVFKMTEGRGDEQQVKGSAVESTL